jgi:hypothetical protein
VHAVERTGSTMAMITPTDMPVGVLRSSPGGGLGKGGEGGGLGGGFGGPPGLQMPARVMQEL